MEMVKEALDQLRGAVMIVYPMGLPPHDPIRMEFEEREDLSGMQVRERILFQWSKSKLCNCLFYYICLHLSLVSSGVSAGDHRGRVPALVGGQRDAEGEEAAGLHRQKWQDEDCGENPKGESNFENWCATWQSVYLLFHEVVSPQKGQGAPAREPLVTEEQHKQMMLHCYRRQQELKVRRSTNHHSPVDTHSTSLTVSWWHLQELEETDTDRSLDSDWSDRGALKKQFQGLTNIKWGPRWRPTGPGRLQHHMQPDAFSQSVVIWRLPQDILYIFKVPWDNVSYDLAIMKLEWIE